MKTKIRHITESVTFQIAALVIVTMLITNIFTILFSQKTMSTLREDSRDSILSIGTLYMSQLDNEIDTIDSYLFSRFPEEESYLKFTSAKTDSEYQIGLQSMYNNLRDEIANHDSGDVYFLYDTETEKGTATVRTAVSTQINLTNADIQKDIIAYLAENQNNLQKHWGIISFGGKRWLIRSMKNESLIVGGLINLDSSEADFQSMLEYDTAEVQILGSGEEPKTEADTGSDEDKLFLHCSSSQADIELVIGISNEELLSSLPLLQRIGMMFSIFLLLLIPLTMYRLHQIVIRPVSVLDQAMARVEHGDNDYQINDTAGSREFRHLFHSFNRMITTQKELKIAVYEEKISRQKQEIQNMRLQIHPHFLLNCFNLMYGLSSSGKMEQLQRMLLYLSDYFRYIFRSGKELEGLGKELELVERYLEIAQMRYPGAFQSQVDLDPSMKNLLIPPLLVHNLVENAINHGLVHDKMVTITVMTYMEDDKAHIIVSDTGRGMPAEETEKFRNGDFSSANKDSQVHLGLRNTSQRIAQYLKDGQLYIDSVEGEGTVIEIEFTP